MTDTERLLALKNNLKDWDFDVNKNFHLEIEDIILLTPIISDITSSMEVSDSYDELEYEVLTTIENRFKEFKDKNSPEPYAVIGKMYGTIIRGIIDTYFKQLENSDASFYEEKAN